jgi:hypothetical protein
MDHILGLALARPHKQAGLGGCDVVYLAMERRVVLSGLRSPARYCANLRADCLGGLQRRRSRGGAGSARAQYCNRGKSRLAVTGAAVPAASAAFPRPRCCEDRGRVLIGQ